MAADSKAVTAVLDCIPQQEPFRFIDEILKLEADAIVSTYRFKEDEYFYGGHFPGLPITPGVILIETMAQTGVVALGIHQLLSQGFEPLQIRRMKPLFAFADRVEFSGVVSPGERVTVRGRKEYFRRGNLKSSITIENEAGETVCSGLLTGAGVQIDA